MRSMVYIYIYILCTLLFIYISKKGIWDHENWIANFDCICCQNFSLKTEFILGFFFYYYLFILITLGGFTQYTYYTRFKLYKKCYKNCEYQTPKNKIVFQKIIFEKWIIFQKTLMLKQAERRYEFFGLFVIVYILIQFK